MKIRSILKMAINLINADELLDTIAPLPDPDNFTLSITTFWVPETPQQQNSSQHALASWCLEITAMFWV